MKILLTLAAGTALLAATSFSGSAASEPSRDYAFGVGTHGPGCTEDVPPGRTPVCSPVALSYSVLAPRNGEGRAWGTVARFNHGNGITRSAAVTCLTVVGNRAIVGGFETAPGNDPFFVFVEDRAPLGPSATDRISAYHILPPGDPEWSLVPRDFPQTCPSSADSVDGYFPLANGDFTVAH